MPTNSAASSSQIAIEYMNYIGYVFFFVGGTLITLLTSIFDVTRRSALKLFAGCVFGGLGALLGGMATQHFGTPWNYICAGLAAVMTENIVLGFLRVSQQFRDSPFATITQFIKDVLPSIPGLKKPD